MNSAIKQPFQKEEQTLQLPFQHDLHSQMQLYNLSLWNNNTTEESAP